METNGFFISVIAGCSFVMSLYVGMIYYRLRDITIGKTRLKIEPQYIKVIVVDEETADALKGRAKGDINAPYQKVD